MKVNPDKFYILLTTKNTTDVHIEGVCITTSLCKNLVEITIDLDFKV